jgi:hypothetical protein
MLFNKRYAIQPYHVGGKDKKSLALVVPSKIVQAFQIDISTIFEMVVDEKNKSLHLQMIKNQINIKE